jgi:hypothetical protein
MATLTAVVPVAVMPFPPLTLVTPPTAAVDCVLPSANVTVPSTAIANFCALR